MIFLQMSLAERSHKNQQVSEGYLSHSYQVDLLVLVDGMGQTAKMHNKHH